MPLVIVTKQCYLVCEKVTFITLEERMSENNAKSEWWVKKKKEKPRTEWVITIDYVPELTQSQVQHARHSSSDNNAVEVRVFNREDAFHLYKEIVTEIREQCPDLLYLDKLIDKVLADFPEAT